MMLLLCLVCLVSLSYLYLSCRLSLFSRQANKHHAGAEAAVQIASDSSNGKGADLSVPRRASYSMTAYAIIVHRVMLYYIRYYCLNCASSDRARVSPSRWAAEPRAHGELGREDDACRGKIIKIIK